MRSSLAALAALSTLTALACRRSPLDAGGHDAGGDAGAPSISDAGRGDTPVAPGSDGAADALDALDELDGASTDAPSDAPRDGTPDAGPATCLAGVLPIEECGCGCCGGSNIGRACYYPARGQTPEMFEREKPSPEACRLVGCIEGISYVCCADPGVQPRSGEICARDTSIEGRPSLAVTRRDGDVCTTLEMGAVFSWLEITVPPGFVNVEARRGPCEGTATRAFALAGFGSVTARGPGAPARSPIDVHVVLFFDNGTGIADAVRIDADDVAVAPLADPSCASR